MITLDSSRVAPNTGSNPNQTTPDQNGSFFGRVWRNYVRPNIGEATELLIPGPLGGIVGGFVQRQVDNCSRAEKVAAQRGISLEPAQDGSGLSFQEQQLLKNWIDNELTPTSLFFVNKISQKVNSNAGFINENVILECNEILKKVAILKAYSSVLLQFGERVNNSNQLFRSESYVMNKTEALSQYVDVVEKSILQFLESNATGYKVVLESFRASSENKVENINLDWQGRTANMNRKKYIKVTEQIGSNQTPVTIVNNSTDGNVEGIEVLNQNADEVVVTKNNKSVWGLGLLVTAAIVAYSALPSDSSE